MVLTTRMLTPDTWEDFVISYADYSETEMDGYAPNVVHADRSNTIVVVDQASAI